MEETFFPGTRVKVFDSSIFKNDKDTPLSMTMKDATVVKWYGHRDENSNWIYENSVDVIFDHKPDRISRGHFVLGVKKIEWMKLLGRQSH